MYLAAFLNLNSWCCVDVSRVVVLKRKDEDIENHEKKFESFLNSRLEIL